jgi:hypothetical protein
MAQQSLDSLAIKYGTDKSSLQHGYTTFYDSIFKNKRNEPIKLMEVGVFYGASIKMWREYFPKGVIYAVDWYKGMNGNGSTFSSATSFIDEVKTTGIDRVEIQNCNQADIGELQKLATNLKDVKFDIIIDYGSHLSKDQQLTFFTLWSLVKPGGVFIIEDICCSLQTGYDNLSDGSNTTLTMLEQFCKTGCLTSKYMDESVTSTTKSEIDRIEWGWTANRAKNQSGTVAIYRKNNSVIL